MLGRPGITHRHLLLYRCRASTPSPSQTSVPADLRKLPMTVGRRGKTHLRRKVHDEKPKMEFSASVKSHRWTFYSKRPRRPKAHREVRAQMPDLSVCLGTRVRTADPLHPEKVMKSSHLSWKVVEIPLEVSLLHSQLHIRIEWTHCVLPVPPPAPHLIRGRPRQEQNRML